MKSKFVFGLLAVMMVLVLAPSSFAQVGITINNSPSPQEVQVNRAAETSDPASSQAGITVSGSLIAQSNLSTTNLILTFPNTITSRAAVYTGGGGDGIGRPPGDPIRIVAATGVFAGAAIATQSGSTITIQLIPADIGGAGNTDSGSFRLVGVRINGNGLTAPASGNASLNSSANNFFLNTTTFPVINALGPGIGSVTSADTFQIFTNRNVTDSSGGVVITEGFASAW